MQILVWDLRIVWKLMRKKLKLLLKVEFHFLDENLKKQATFYSNQNIAYRSNTVLLCTLFSLVSAY